MAIDASHAPVDDSARRPTTDLPTEQGEVPPVRAKPRPYGLLDPGAPDGGTTFRPPEGYDYFLGLH